MIWWSIFMDSLLKWTCGTETPISGTLLVISCDILYIYIHIHIITYIYIYIYIQCEAPKISKLVNITPMSLWFMLLITIVTGAFVDQRSHLWGPHIVWNHMKQPCFTITTDQLSGAFRALSATFFFLHLDQDLKIAQHFRLVNYYNLPDIIYIYTGWWFQTFYYFSIYWEWNVIIPTDEFSIIFSDG